MATGLEIDFAGIKVSEVEPKVLPNLYHGAPVRIYGRYQGGGQAQVSLRGSITGVELKKTAGLEFPREDLANPEIARMWAWHRIDGLLKQADRDGSRDGVIGEVVRLGEGYSIATEYTSFLVLENDAEYQRWKIARNNALRTERDRNAQEIVRAQLAVIRNKAVANLGPQPETRTPAPQTTAPASPPPEGRRQSFDFGVGSGPVGPLFLGLLLWLRRQQRRAA